MSCFLFFETLTHAHFRSLLWVGPALLFSTATAISILGWDGKVRPILSISMPYAGNCFCYILGCHNFLSIHCFIGVFFFQLLYFILALLICLYEFLFAVLVGALNDRLLLASPTEINPRQKKGVEIKSCLVGLLEPILIGFATMQLSFEQKLDLSEILYQITSRFISFTLLNFNLLSEKYNL